MPSHLDWTEAVRDQHAGLIVTWPETKRFEDAGLRDTFRMAHPDLLTVDYWKGMQRALRKGWVPRIEVYPAEARLRHPRRE